jgi:hypothetical protein
MKSLTSNAAIFMHSGSGLIGPFKKSLAIKALVLAPSLLSVEDQQLLKKRKEGLAKSIPQATLDTENRRKPLFQIASEEGVNASQETIRRAFLKEGYVRRIARKKVYLTAAHKMRRLEFARRHQNWTVTDWRKTIWTDECYIWLSGSAGKTYITRKTGNSIQYNNR